MKTKTLSPKTKQHLLAVSLVLFLISLFSCNSSVNEQDGQDAMESLPEEKNIVDTMVIHTQDFTQEIISNGKLAATQKAELWFKNSGIVETVFVKNGQTVTAGSLLAKLYEEEFLFSYNKAKLSLENSELDLQSKRIELSHEYGDDIPDELLEVAKIRLGYAQSEINFEEAEQALNNINVVAPFSGIVEGVTQRPFERANQSEPFCTLINDQRFTIEFPLLETEYNQVETGQKISISPIALNKPATGVITEINPRVDENGLIKVRAEVNNPGGYIEGMNVKVNIKRSIPNQLVVPKEAVVLRQNREVLFRYTSEGKAYWTYINVLDENETQYAVKAAEGATLASGDTIIVSNNLNLAHNTEVEVGN